MPTLRVSLHSAQNLPAKNLSTPTSDPIVIATCNGKHLFKTEPIMMNCNPVWDQNHKIKHEFLVEIPNPITDKFIIEVQDYNIFYKNHPIGSVHILLTRLEKKKPQLLTFTLTDSHGKSAGTITMWLEAIDFGTIPPPITSLPHVNSGNNLIGGGNTFNTLSSSSTTTTTTSTASSPQQTLSHTHSFNTTPSVLQPQQRLSQSFFGQLPTQPFTNMMNNISNNGTPNSPPILTRNQSFMGGVQIPHQQQQQQQPISQPIPPMYETPQMQQYPTMVVNNNQTPLLPIKD